MRLGTNWKSVVQKAWSFRLMLLAAVLTGLEAVLPFFAVPKLFVFLIVAGALVARIVAQKDLP